MVLLDSLISEPGSWCAYLRTAPGWLTWTEDRRRMRAVMSVHAEDNLGGMYVTFTGSGGFGHRDWQELVLRFRPRLDPLARALKLTFTAAGEHAAAELRLSPAAKPELQRSR